MILGNRSAFEGEQLEYDIVAGASDNEAVALFDLDFISVGRYALAEGPTVELLGMVGPDYTEVQELLSSEYLTPTSVMSDVILHYAHLADQQEALWQNGLLLHRGPRAVGQGFNLVFEIVLSLLREHGVLCVLHGSAVEWQGKRIIFLGLSGSGKSTLAALFAAHGASYIGDDYVAVLRDGNLVTVPLAPSIKRGSLPILTSPFPQLSHAVERTLGTKAYKYLADAPWSTDRGKANLLVFPVFSETSAQKFVELTDVETLLNLGQSGVWVPPECFDNFLQVILDIRAIALRHTRDFCSTQILLRSILEDVE